MINDYHFTSPALSIRNCFLYSFFYFYYFYLMIFQSLGLIVPHDILDIVYDQYTVQENLQLYNTSSSSMEINNNNSKLNISKEDWINLVENCLLQELKNQEKKRIENILKIKVQLKEENDKIERRNNYHLYNDNDFDDVHNDDYYYDEINRQKANFNSSEKMKNEKKKIKMKKQKQSRSLSAVTGTENSMRRSVSTTPLYVHTEGSVDPYSVCDRRARSFSAPRGRVFGVGDRDQERDEDRDGDGGRYMDEIRMRVKKGEREGREDEVEWKGEGEGDIQGRGGRQPYASTVHRIRSSSAGATGRYTGLTRRPSPRASDHGLFFGPGSGSCHRMGTGTVMGTGTGGKGFISSFSRGGMKNRVGHYNHRQQQQLQQHHYHDINQKHNGKKHDKQEKRNIPFYNNVEFKVLSPLNRPFRTQQNKNTTLIDNKDVSEQPFNDSETSYGSPSLLNRKRASELARIRYE